MRPTRQLALATALLGATPVSAAASNEATASWLSWIVIGAIVLFVAGIIVRMVLAARFPRGYATWARERREAFASRNASWDRADDSADSAPRS